MNIEINSKFKSAHEEIEKSQKTVKAALLIEETSQSEREILKNAGLDFGLREQDELVGLSLDRKKVQEEFDCKFFATNEIKELCHKYHLRILHSSMYNGSLNKETGAKLIEFFSIDDAQKRRGTKRDILFINEANELTYEDFFQLNIRTTTQV